MILPSVVLPAPLGPTIARRSPGRDVEGDAVEHERAGVVAEHDVVGRARRPRSSRRVGGSADLARRGGRPGVG